jgi:hypothetical protein
MSESQKVSPRCDHPQNEYPGAPGACRDSDDSLAKHWNNPQYSDSNSTPLGSRVSSLRDGQEHRKPPQDS